jgi:hypothetical protein
LLSIDPRLALDAAARLSACGAMISSLEMIAVRNEFRKDGVFNLQGIVSLYGKEGAVFNLLDRTLLLALIAVACSAAIVILFGPFQAIGQIAVVVCFANRLLVRWRRLLGGDGAEQMTTLVLAATLLAVLPHTSEARIHLAVAFIGAQATLSYVTAGIAKLLSPVWRSGAALPVIMGTEIHGHPRVASALAHWRRSAAVLGWSVIAFECLFPLLIIGPSWLAIAALILGLIFHAGCAATMGLNNFLWAFPATYPCVLVLASWLSPFW